MITVGADWWFWALTTAIPTLAILGGLGYLDRHIAAVHRDVRVAISLLLTEEADGDG